MTEHDKQPIFLTKGKYAMLGERLQEIRKERNLTQKQLANKLEISIHTVASYERGKSSPDDGIMVQIAKILDISIDYLLGLTNYGCSYQKPQIIKIPPDTSKETVKEIQKYADYCIRADYDKRKQSLRQKRGGSSNTAERGD